MRMTAVTTAMVVASLLPQLAQAQFPGRWKTDFSKHTVPLDEITSGGVPKDGIPAIDDPKFISVRAAGRWLEDREPVVIVDLDGVVKAYPIQILIWHEIVNDIVGTTPVSVTYCPLCNTALSFDRRFEGRVLDFGTTGNLRHSDLVMYDRQTETWWQQATGEGIVGEYAGRELRFISSPLVAWKTFKNQYPDAQVLSRDTGHRRRYGDNPYVGYDSQQSPIAAFFRGKNDNRLPAMERIVALEIQGDARAYPFSALEKSRAVNDEPADEPIVVLWAPGTASALDTPSIASGRDIGATGVFSRTLGSRVLTFEPDEHGLFKDRETGTTWNVLGHAVSGQLSGRRLEPIQHGNHFWFAWVVFRPDTKVIR